MPRTLHTRRCTKRYLGKGTSDVLPCPLKRTGSPGFTKYRRQRTVASCIVGEVHINTHYAAKAQLATAVRQSSFEATSHLIELEIDLVAVKGTTMSWCFARQRLPWWRIINRWTTARSYVGLQLGNRVDAAVLMVYQYHGVTFRVLVQLRRIIFFIKFITGKNFHFKS